MDDRSRNLFLKLYDTRNVSRAALELGIAQPNLSRMLQSWEEKLGVALFYRQTDGLKPTAEGEAYKRCFEQINELLRQTGERIQSQREEIAGSLRVAMHPIIGKKIVPGIEKLAIGIPALSIHYQFCDSRVAMDRLLDHEVDFAIVASVFQFQDVKRVKLWSERIHLVAKDPQMKDVLCVNPTMINAEKIIRRLKPRLVRHFSDYEVLLSVVRGNEAMALIPGGLTLNEPGLHSLKNFKPQFDISLVFGTNRSLSQLDRWFIDGVSKLFIAPR